MFSVLSNPEVQGLFKKPKYSSPKHVSTVTPITPPKIPNDETLAIIDMSSSSKISEKKKPIRHATSQGGGDSLKIHHSPANIAMHSPANIPLHSPDGSVSSVTTTGSTKSNRSVAHKQHSLDDHVRHHNNNNNNHDLSPINGENKSTKHHNSNNHRTNGYHKQHTTGHDSPIIYENHDIDTSHKHSSKGDNNQNGEKWVAASRSRHGKK